MYLAGSYIILIDFVCSTCNLNAVMPKFVIYLLISTLSNISENFRALARHLLLLLRSTLLVTVVSNSRIIRMSACVSLGCGGCWTFPGWCHGRLFLPAAAWWTARQTSLAHWRQHPWQPGVCVCVCVCVWVWVWETCWCFTIDNVLLHHWCCYYIMSRTAVCLYSVSKCKETFVNFKLILV